jgi:hypothetical protein
LSDDISIVSLSHAQQHRRDETPRPTLLVLDAGSATCQRDALLRSTRSSSLANAVRVIAALQQFVGERLRVAAPTAVL